MNLVSFLVGFSTGVFAAGIYIGAARYRERKMELPRGRR